MEYRFTSSPRVPADPALPQTAEEEDAEEDAEESDDSDLEYIRLERERMEYIRTHGLPTDYLVDFTSEQLQWFDGSLPGRREIRELPGVQRATAMATSYGHNTIQSTTAASTKQSSTTGGTTLHCRSLEFLSCDDVQQISSTLECNDCVGCCTDSSPPTPPQPSPAYPSTACPWVNGSTSGEAHVLECMDGTRCNWFTDPATYDCCDCHGGRARCPMNYPFMSASLCDLPRRYHCCLGAASELRSVGGERPCPSAHVHTPAGECTPPPPAPPAPPPRPPQPPLPPLAPFIFEWQHHFTLLQPAGTNCYLSADFTAGIDYTAHDGDLSAAACANQCLRMANCVRDLCATSRAQTW